MAILTPPSGTKFGRVTASVFSFVKDSDDSDLQSDDVNVKGYITFAPNIDYVIDSDGEFFATPPQPYSIPDNGTLVVDLLATNSPNMQPKGWMYHVTIALEGGKTIEGNITVPADSNQKLGLALGAGQQPGVIVADQGGKGDPGPPNSLSIGTVVGGTSAAASITGTSPNQTLNLTLPQGAKGDTGSMASLSIGTVVKGSPAAATISGSAGSQTLNLTLPPGDPGANAANPVFKTSATKLAAGATPTVDLSGTYPNLNLLFGLPPGADGNPSQYELRGQGSPVGNVTPSAIGIGYTDTNGTAGAIKWISTGTTSQSWMVLIGDTGTRNITSLVTNIGSGYSNPSFRWRQQNNHCFLRVTFDAVGSSKSPGLQITGIPAFADPNNSYFIGNTYVNVYRSNGQFASVGLNGTGALSAATWPNSDVNALSFYFEWLVQNNFWVSSLPGISG